MCEADVQIIRCHRYHVPWDCTNTENKDISHIGKKGPKYVYHMEKIFPTQKKTPKIFNDAKDCVHLLAHHLAKRVGDS